MSIVSRVVANLLKMARTRSKLANLLNFAPNHLRMKKKVENKTFRVILTVSGAWYSGICVSGVKTSMCALSAKQRIVRCFRKAFHIFGAVLLQFSQRIVKEVLETFKRQFLLVVFPRTDRRSARFVVVFHGPLHQNRFVVLARSNLKSFQFEQMLEDFSF